MRIRSAPTSSRGHPPPSDRPYESSVDLILTNISEIVTLEEFGPGPAHGPVNRLKTIQGASVAVSRGEIIDVDTLDQLTSRMGRGKEATVVDLGGRAVVPGFIDSHSHSVYAGSRAGEYLLRLDGAKYLDIAARGGGLQETVAVSSRASSEELLEGLLERTARAFTHGTTTAEVKTGYWLSLDGERNALEVITRASAIGPVSLVPTFMGASTVPANRDSDTYVRHLVEEMLPEVTGLARFCDVVCDRGHFTLDQTQRILEAAASLGMGLKVHADEFADVGAGMLAASMRAASADHLCFSGTRTLAALARSNTVAVVLPTAKLFLLAPKFASARRMVNEGIAVALGTDHGPSSPMESMPFVIAAACHHLGLTPEEALIAATWNAAVATGRFEAVGKLVPGYRADMVVLDMPSYRYIPYFADRPIVWRIVKDGRVHVGDAG